MKKNASARIILDPNITTGERRLMIKVIHNRDNRRYSSGCEIKITKEEFENGRKNKTKQAKEEANEALNIANEIIKELGTNFTFSSFKKYYEDRLFGEHKDKTQFIVIGEEYISSQPLKIKTKNIYNSSLNWIKQYNEKLMINDITNEKIEQIITFIKNKHLETKGTEIKENTIRIYLRHLRAIYNYGIQQGIAKQPNPFSHIKGQSLNSIGSKKIALNEEEFEKIIEYKPANKTEEMAKDFFILSMQLSGANIGDILLLKNENIINDDRIEFIRTKTQKSGMITSIPFTPLAKQYFEKYGELKKDNPQGLIFPFLESYTTEKAINNKKGDIIWNLNYGLKCICQNLGIRKITTVAARHTYASFAQSEGFTAEQIQKFLGHTSSRTTQHYIKSLTNSDLTKNKELLNKIMKK